MGRPEQDEIDFLMETEYSLQSQLERVQNRLELLLGAQAVQHSVEAFDPFERHLTLVPNIPGDFPDGAA